MNSSTRPVLRRVLQAPDTLKSEPRHHVQLASLDLGSRRKIPVKLHGIRACQCIYPINLVLGSDFSMGRRTNHICKRGRDGERHPEEGREEEIKVTRIARMRHQGGHDSWCLCSPTNPALFLYALL